MSLPFTTEAFLDVFRRYNEAVWPAQWALTALGAAAALLARRARANASRAAAALLAALWLWTGVVYHLGFFRRINPAAVLFAAACVAQAAALAWWGAWRGRIDFRPRRDAAGAVGAALVLYALVLYPLLGLALGHRYPAAPTFGLPCPTTILTFGLLLWALPTLPRALLVVPTLWALVGVSAAARLGMVEDWALPAAALATAVLLVLRPRRGAGGRVAARHA